VSATPQWVALDAATVEDDTGQVWAAVNAAGMLLQPNTRAPITLRTPLAPGRFLVRATVRDVVVELPKVEVRP